MIADNLLRALMCEASAHERLPPTQLSLQGARQHFNQFRPLLAQAKRQECQHLHEILLNIVCAQLLPLRPNRAEPSSLQLDSRLEETKQLLNRVKQLTR